MKESMENPKLESEFWNTSHFGSKRYKEDFVTALARSTVNYQV